VEGLEDFAGAENGLGLVTVTLPFLCGGHFLLRGKDGGLAAGLG